MRENLCGSSPHKKKTKWEENRTMINIRKDTKAELEKLGTMRESFDDVVLALVTFIKENRDLWNKFRDDKH